MTRKHFKAIAEIFAANRQAIIEAGKITGADVHTQLRLNAVDAVMCDIAGYLKTQNPNFDKARFLEACTK